MDVSLIINIFSYSLKKLAIAPDNESAWNYING